MNFDPKDYRRALGKFATGVTVITALDAHGDDLGVTASSFNTVSIDPALILWSVDKNAYSAEIFRNAEHFAVNVLNDSQVDISNCFARRGEDKFKDIDVARGLGGVALINGASAHFECKTWQVYDGGDHLIIVGQVEQYHYSDTGNSLVFHNGRYAVSEMHPSMKSLNGNVTAEGGVLNDYLLYLLRQALFSCCDDFYPKLSAFGVTAEEWRVLTLLSGKEGLTPAVISQLVFQPPQQLDDTLDWLGEKGMIITEGERVSLTDAGQDMSSKLLEMAFQHERQVTRDLNAEQLNALRDGLKSLIQSVGR